MKSLILAGMLFLFITLFSGCLGSGKVAKAGDNVSVDYWLTVDGSQIDTSEGRGLFDFTLGASEVIPGFDKAVTGMKVGETKEVDLSGKDAYTAGPLAGKKLHFKIQLVSINE